METYIYKNITIVKFQGIKERLKGALGVLFLGEIYIEYINTKSKNKVTYN